MSNRLYDSAHKANKEARDGLFRSDVLQVLNRIADSLEKMVNPMITVNPPEPLSPEPEVLPIRHTMTPDGVCVCGNDLTRTCDACSASRLAQVYKASGGSFS